VKEEDQTNDITISEKVSEKSRKHFKYRSNECLNCGQPLDLSDRYCPYCSQLNSTKHLSLSDFFGEFLKSIISYDSRLRYTLKDLLFKPGTITKNYIRGQRLIYANPFRFFLSVSIIYFLATTFINSYITNDRDEFNTQLSSDGVLFNLINNNTPENKKIDSLMALSLTSKEGVQPLSVTQINDTIKKYNNLKKQNKTTTNNDFTYITQKEIDTLSWGNASARKIETYIKFYENTKIINAKKALDSLNHTNTKFNRWLYDKNHAYERMKADPYGFYSYMINKIPFFLFFFTPFFALFFWLLYYNKKINYMEHMVFIFHIFSFIFLCMIIALIVDTIIGAEILLSILFLIIGPFYFYKALRNFYKQNRIFTVLKFLTLSFIFFLGSSLVATFFFLITAAVY